MKNKLISTFLLILLIAILPACTITVNTDNGPTITENREIGQIHAVSFSMVGDLTITQGEKEALTITGAENVLKHITTENNNGVLEIGYDITDWSDPLNLLSQIHYYLTVKDLNSIQLSGAGSIHTDSLSTENLSVGLTGAGNITINNLQTQNLNVMLSGAGSFDVSGVATTQNVTLTGVGDYRGGDLQSEQADIVLSGAGGATVWTSSQLDVTISGAGSVSYYGNPVLTQTISGVGSLNHKGNK